MVSHWSAKVQRHGLYWAELDPTRGSEIAKTRPVLVVSPDAISQYVEREEKRETFRQAGIQAWNEYHANGLHVTLEEADAWLAKLEEGQDVEPPECHV